MRDLDAGDGAEGGREDFRFILVRGDRLGDDVDLHALGCGGGVPVEFGFLGGAWSRTDWSLISASRNFAISAEAFGLGALFVARSGPQADTPKARADATASMSARGRIFDRIETFLPGALAAPESVRDQTNRKTRARVNQRSERREPEGQVRWHKPYPGQVYEGRAEDCLKYTDGALSEDE